MGGAGVGTEACLAAHCRRCAAGGCTQDFKLWVYFCCCRLRPPTSAALPSARRQGLRPQQRQVDGNRIPPCLHPVFLTAPALTCRSARTAASPAASGWCAPRQTTRQWCGAPWRRRCMCRYAAGRGVWRLLHGYSIASAECTAACSGMPAFLYLQSKLKVVSLLSLSYRACAPQPRSRLGRTCHHARLCVPCPTS